MCFKCHVNYSNQTNSFIHNFPFRLQFRKLIRMYDCNLCFTPMIMADSYVKSAKARAHEFQTDTGLYGNYYLNKLPTS